MRIEGDTIKEVQQEYFEGHASSDLAEAAGSGLKSLCEDGEQKPSAAEALLIRHQLRHG
jgi:hypothetical protein